jgi:phospholipid/cholesterol/gamma-HCH transport system substrate-binding protein
MSAQPPEQPPPERRPRREWDPLTILPKNLGVKVGMLLAFTILVAVTFVVYVLFARGTFEQTQRLYLIADNAEGVRVGMDLTFAGFAIGTVRRIRLREDGKVRISVRVQQEEAKWLRTSSVFTLEVPLVGSARLRAFSGNLKDPPLDDRAERPVLRGDTADEIPRLVASVRQVLENIDQLTDQSSALQESLKNARAVSERMAGKYGMLGAVMGGEDNAKKIIASIDRANALIASLDGVTLKLDRVLAQADTRVFGEGGVVDETQRAVLHANVILGQVGESLKQVDGILANAQAASGNVKSATTDLGALRAEVEASLRRITSLVEEINRKWPFERDTKIKLP